MTWITSIDVLDCRFHLKQKPLGDWLEESGWCNLLTNLEIAFAGKAESFLNASHVTRTRYAHQVTAATLHILMTKAYEKHSIEKNIISDFKTWRKDKELQYPQFYFWSQTLLSLLMPLFFAFIHTHYAHWLSVHLCDMLQSQETNPEVFRYFNEGHFVVAKSKRAFSSLGIGHAHEQNNKCVKEDSGTFVF